MTQIPHFVDLDRIAEMFVYEARNFLRTISIRADPERRFANIPVTVSSLHLKIEKFRYLKGSALHRPVRT
jgi:hypothetical protein